MRRGTLSLAALVVALVAGGCRFGENIHIHYHATGSDKETRPAEDRIRDAFGGPIDDKQTVEK